MPISPETDLVERGWCLDEAGSLIEVRTGVEVPEIVRAHGPLGGVPTIATSSIGGAFEVRVEAAYSSTHGHYVLRELSLTAPDDGDITGVLIRAVPPLEVMRWILPRTFTLDDSVASAAVVDFIAPEIKPHRGHSRHSPHAAPTVSDVGTIYRLATIVRYPPAKAVAEACGMQPRTATNWIARARHLGLT